MRSALYAPVCQGMTVSLALFPIVLMMACSEEPGGEASPHQRAGATSDTSESEAEAADTSVADNEASGSAQGAEGVDASAGEERGGQDDAASPDDALVTLDAGQSADGGSGEVVAFKNLAYTPPAGVTSDLATLDLYRVDDGVERPLMLLVHGGSWISGDKGGFEDKIVPWCLERGYAAAAVNFRLASKPADAPPFVKPADQVRDIAAALAWLMDQAETHTLASDGIVLMGYSSGAHLVALLGTDEAYLEEVGLEPTSLAASISLDVHAYDVPYALELMVGSVVDANRGSIRFLFGQSEAEQLQSSPIHFVDGWAAPAFIVSVDQDPEEVGTHGYIVSKAAERYVSALSAAGHHAERFHDANETHSSLVGGFGEEGDLVTDAIGAFLDGLGLP